MCKKAQGLLMLVVLSLTLAGFVLVPTIATANGERLSAGASKGSYLIGESVVIQGVILNAANRPIVGTIVVNDGVAGRCTLIASNFTGKFTYVTTATRAGVFQVQFLAGTGMTTLTVTVMPRPA